MIALCTGSRMYPGCWQQFEATTAQSKFCPECAKLDKASSFVFVERRRALLGEGEDECSQ